MKNLGIFKDNKDGTIKCTFSSDYKIIEMSLLMNKENEDVICAPTHHFCSLGCKICHLTNNKLNKQMVKINVEDFIEALKNTVCNKKTGKRRTNKKTLLISFMGVGEPLLNIDLIVNIFKKEEELKNQLGYDYIGYALATMMPNAEKFLELQEKVLQYNIPLKVHFSLHTPIDNNRKELIPATKISVNDAFELLKNYSDNIKNNEVIMKSYNHFHKTKDIVEIHYTLIKDINDSDIELSLISEYLNKYKLTLKFIRFNPKDKLFISQKEDMWVNYLKEKTTSRIKTYSPPGKEVGSSCGEFTKHYYHEEIETKEEKLEFEKWKRNHEIKD